MIYTAENMLGLLKEARKLVDEGWTQNAWARNATGEPCVVVDSDAVSFCFSGALIRADWDLSWSQAVVWIMKHHMPEGFEGKLISEYNDTKGRTKKQMLDWIDHLIAEAEKAIANV